MRHITTGQKNDFQKLIKDKGYQVFLFVCPVSLPFSFASHPWFVCVRNGEVSRWEVRYRADKNSLLGKHLYHNDLPIFSGIEMFYFISKKFLWSGKLFGHIEGDENSLASKMYYFIENSKDNYPYCNRYHLLGPNSNTYAQMVLDNFPECGLTLPVNAVGKGFKKWISDKKIKI